VSVESTAIDLVTVWDRSTDVNIWRDRCHDVGRWGAHCAGLGENEAPSPTQIKEGVSVLVELLDGAATDIEGLRGAAALETRVDTFAKPDKLGRKIGLKACVQRG
jgi:hypothetical protein